MSTDNKTSTRLIVASALLASGIFLSDLLLPLGVACGVPYVAIVLLSLWLPGKRSTWGAAILVSILALVGFVFSASGGILWMVIVNRSLALFVIWVTALLCLARKRAEERLRLQGQIVDSMAEGISLVRPSDGIIIYCNPPFERMFGYEPGELLGQHVTMNNAPGEKSPQETTQEISQSLDESGSWTGEVHNIKKDGTHFWSHANITTLQHPDHGRVWVGVLADITERKQSEEDLRQSQFAVEHCSNPIYWVRKDGRIIYANEAASRSVGYSRDELVSMSVPQLGSDFPQEAWPAHWQEMKRDKRSTFEARHRHKDGRVFPVQITTSFLEYKSQEFIWAYVTDITERKLAEAALRESERRFRTTFESAAIAMALDDEQGRLIETNATFQKMFGNSAKELEGMTFSELTHPADVDRGWNLFKELVQGKRDSVHLERRYYRQDGTLLWGSVNVSAIRNRDGSFRHTVTMVQDITARKLAEDALRFTQFAVDHNSDATYWVRSDGRISYVNHAACQALGYSYQELISMRVPDIDPEFPDEKWGAHFLEIKEAGSMTFEAQHRTKSGRLFPVEILANYLAYDDQEYLCAYVRDITERKRAEEVLRESESKYRELFESAYDIICLVDGEGNIVDINRRGELLTGYSRAELRQMNLLRELVVPEDRDLPRRLLERAGPGEEHVYEMRWRTKDGRTIHLEGASTFRFSPTGEFLSTRCTLRDITERKRVEAERERLMSAIEQARETIIITDADAVIKYVNPAFERITGYSRAEAVGENPNIVKSGRHDAGFYKEMWDTLARGDTWTGEIINKKKDGTLYTEETTISPVFDAAGKTVNYVAVKHDITERKRAEEQTRQLQADLAHMSRLSSMGEMATGLAHELNQPLTAITNYALGCVRRLKSNSISQDELENILSRIASQARRSGSIIRGLENLVLKSSALRFEIDINHCIMEVADLANAEATQHRAKARFELEPNLPLVMADQTQLQQVILNLVQNGCEAIQDTPESRRAVTVRTKQRGDRELEISVSDNGCGISESLGERLFEPFVTTKAQGIGMGLAISRSIVESHGGRLWATPNRGKGTTFHFTLPIVGGGDGDE